MGAKISTVGDVARFYRALLTGRLLPPAEQRELLTTIPVDDTGELRAGAAGYRSAPRSASRQIPAPYAHGYYGPMDVTNLVNPARFSAAVLRRRGVAPIRRSITTAVPCQIRGTAAR